jgi:hypothetical protein
LAQLLHGAVEAVPKLYKSVGWPELFPHPLASNHFAGIFQQHPQDLEGLALEFYPDPVLACFTRLKI